VALTMKQIENAKPKDKPYKIADGGGLCLLVAPFGARLWRWRYRFDGREKMMAFGEFPLVTLKAARELHFAARQRKEARTGSQAARQFPGPKDRRGGRRVMNDCPTYPRSAQAYRQNC
jgi:hypothetical protein